MLQHFYYELLDALRNGEQMLHFGANIQNILLTSICHNGNLMKACMQSKGGGTNNKYLPYKCFTIGNKSK